MRRPWHALSFIVLATASSWMLTACGINNPAFLGHSTTSTTTTTDSSAQTVTISLSGPASVTLGSQSQYAATVTGAADPTVAWSVNGVQGGNSSLGTISTSGLYTAPTTAASSSITVTAASVASPTTAKSLTVALTAPPTPPTQPTQPTQPTTGTGSTSVPVTLVLTGAMSVDLGSSTQYSAVVSGTTNTAVVWSVNGVAGGNEEYGSVSATGLYTAPANMPTGAQVTITAASAADATVFQTVTVTLTPSDPTVSGGNSAAVTVALSGSTSVTLGATAQYAATVTGGTGGVAWSVNGVQGGNAANGTISASGLYTAPATAPANPTVTVTATSVDNPTVSESLNVALTAPQNTTAPGSGVAPVTVSLTGAAEVTLGATAQYTATVGGSGNTGVLWSVDGIAGGNTTYGTISAGGLYTAPATLPTIPTVTITATSAADGTVFQTMSVSLQQPVIPASIAVSGATSLTLGATTQFQAVVSGMSNSAVLWRVNGMTGGSAAYGTISASGLYKAPAAMPATQTVTITATSAADASISQSVTVTLQQPAPVVTLTLSGATTVTLGATAQYSAVVSGASNTAVIWRVNGMTGGSAAYGIISATGLYTAPAAMPATQAVTITATSVAATSIFQSMNVTLKQPATSSGSGKNGVTLTLSGPTAATLNKTAQYSATVSGDSDTSVTWSVNGVTGGSAALGTISTSGLYTAPASMPSKATVTITATSNADASVSQSLAVALSAPAVTVPITVTLSGATSVQLNGSAQYAAAVSGSSNTAVVWSVDGVQGGESSVGTITAAGLYTAPATAPASSKVTITATSVASSSVSQSITVTLTTPPPAVSLTLTGATSVTLGTTAQYTAAVSNSSNTGVIWSVNGVTGGNTANGTISTTGLYTAPSTAPQPSTVTITATAAASASASQSLVVTLKAPANASRIPANAISSGDLNPLNNWQWTHDPGTPGTSSGWSTYPVTGLSADNSARQFSMSYANGAGEIYHVSFARDTTATHFVYDTYVYISDPTQLKNLEMDMNDVMADGRLVLLGTQCAGYTKSWEYTMYSNGGFHWVSSNIPCDPGTWTAKTWHHIQIASHRDNNGNAYYDWVNVDGTYSNFTNASGLDSANLGWAIGDLLINFQIDGPSKQSGSNLIYTDKLQVWRW